MINQKLVSSFELSLCKIFVLTENMLWFMIRDYPWESGWSSGQKCQILTIQT